MFCIKSFVYKFIAKHVITDYWNGLCKDKSINIKDHVICLLHINLGTPGLYQSVYSIIKRLQRRQSQRFAQSVCCSCLLLMLHLAHAPVTISATVLDPICQIHDPENTNYQNSDKFNLECPIRIAISLPRRTDQFRSKQNTILIELMTQKTSVVSHIDIVGIWLSLSFPKFLKIHFIWGTKSTSPIRLLLRYHGCSRDSTGIIGPTATRILSYILQVYLRFLPMLYYISILNFIGLFLGLRF